MFGVGDWLEYQQKFPGQLQKIAPILHELHKNYPKMVSNYSQFKNMYFQSDFGQKISFPVYSRQFKLGGIKVPPPHTNMVKVSLDSSLTKHCHLRF